jgi:hypothetical protein
MKQQMDEPTRISRKLYYVTLACVVAYVLSAYFFVIK